MRKRDQKREDKLKNNKDSEVDSWANSEQSEKSSNQPSPIKIGSKRARKDLNEDFMAFDDEAETKFKHVEPETLEKVIATKHNTKEYPWLSGQTMRIKDIFLYLHSEILDFTEYLS